MTCSLLTKTQLGVVAGGWACVRMKGWGGWAEQESVEGGQGMVKTMSGAPPREGQEGLPSRS